MRVLPLFVALLLIAGCAPDDPAPPADPDADNDFDEMEDVSYHAVLDGQAGFEGVSGEATAHVDDGQTHVNVSLMGAPPNGTHPWHVHSGACGSGGGVVGNMAAYPALETDADGDASASATINYALDAGAMYHVNVHASADQMATIVACGDLQAD